MEYFCRCLGCMANGKKPLWVQILCSDGGFFLLPPVTVSHSQNTTWPVPVAISSEKSCSWSKQYQKTNIICLPSAPQIPLNLNMRKNCYSTHLLPHCEWFTNSDHHRPTVQTDKCEHGEMSTNWGDCPNKRKNCPCKSVAQATALFVYLYGCFVGVSMCQVGDSGNTATCLLPSQPMSAWRYTFEHFCGVSHSRKFLYLYLHSIYLPRIKSP